MRSETCKGETDSDARTDRRKEERPGDDAKTTAKQIGRKNYEKPDRQKTEEWEETTEANGVTRSDKAEA